MPLPDATLVVYASYANQLGSSSGSASAHRAIFHTAEVVPRDGGARRCAVERFLERQSVLGAHYVVQDRVHGGAEVVQATAERIQPVVNVVEGRHLIHVQ